MIFILCKKGAMRGRWLWIGWMALAVPAHAQLAPGLPALPLPAGQVLDRVGQEVQGVTGGVAQRLEDVRRTAAAKLVRDNPDRIALDPDGFPARAGEVVVDDPDDALIARAVAKGYAVIAREDVLGVGYARLSVPRGRSLGQAIRELRKLGGKEVSADQLHAPSGALPGPAAPVAAGGGTVVGVIDGGAAGAALSSGFATGAPRANDHGTAVASLIAGAGTVRGGLPGARIASADVYGSDPAGGNATAIARAVGWMVQNRVSVVTISLVGPANPLLGKVIAAAQARGTVIVAAVGNNGPAAPPAYPASYPGVIAVTGIDGKGRALIEAGRASHLDYAAPGADMLAIGANGRTMRVRGTSFAAPFVAATIARVYATPDPGGLRAAIGKVDAQARDAGSRGPDKLYGRGVLCEACRTPAQ
ncbi:S8 family serine peptidase [Sphingomonas sp. NIBR02145]|uniref:S8 family serine peptidase n=1 Tax=Sphingomonas sp. NIBR02145 TaxID=3014784 RepID=UPI0022B4A1BE|nr:S8 family serine peptidase [Sphingomonas sp. NIBR02145]WHU04244.1 S8 family serine peptidase [Sphingomonas sp. NIBR02145]